MWAGVLSGFQPSTRRPLSVAKATFSASGRLTPATQSGESKLILVREGHDHGPGSLTRARISEFGTTPRTPIAIVAELAAIAKSDSKFFTRIEENQWH